MSSSDKIIDSNPPLKELCSHDSQAGQKAHVLLCDLTLGLKRCSTLLDGYQNETSLTFSGCRNGFQNKPSHCQQIWEDGEGKGRNISRLSI